MAFNLYACLIYTMLNVVFVSVCLLRSLSLSVVGACVYRAIQHTDAIPFYFFHFVFVVVVAPRLLVHINNVRTYFAVERTSLSFSISVALSVYMCAVFDIHTSHKRASDAFVWYMCLCFVAALLRAVQRIIWTGTVANVLAFRSVYIWKSVVCPWTTTTTYYHHYHC